MSANFVIGEFNKKRNEYDGQYREGVHPRTAGRLLEMVFNDQISLKTAKELFGRFWDEVALTGAQQHTPEEIEAIIDSGNLKQLSDSTAIEKMVNDVIIANPKSVEEYKAGKEKALNALFGQVMKASNKTANPAQVTEILKKKLSE